MKQSKKVLSLLVIFIMLASLLAACSSGTKTEETNSPASTEKAAAASEKPTEKVILKYWAWMGEEAYVNPIVEAFNKSQDKIVVETNFWDSSKINDASAQNPLIVALAGGEAIDLFGSQNSAVLSGFSSRKQIVDLTDLIARDKFDTAPYGSLFQSNMIDGKVPGLMYRQTFWALYYNKDVFDQAKVPYPKEGITWAEYRDLAKTLTSGSGADKIYGTFNDTWASSTLGQAAQEGKTVGIPGSDDAIKKAMAYWRSIWIDDKSIKSWGDISTQKLWTVPEFETGKVAMTVHGEWLPGMVNADKKAGKTKINYDVIPAPVNDGVAVGTSWTTPTTLMISVNSKHVDEAWEFMKFMCGAQGADLMAKSSNYPGYITPQIIDAYVSNIGAEPGNIKNVLSKLQTKMETGADPKINGMINAFQEENELVQLGEKSVDDAFAEYTKKVSDLK